MPVDYKAVEKAIKELLESPESKKYDDGSFGPVLVRLAWHASGTYNQFDGTGGSNGATMRFAPESSWGANAGLDIARQILEPVKQKFPEITYGDLWTLASVVAIEHMGGPRVFWRPGRKDADDGKTIVEDGRLPDASKDGDHIRAIFYRMGFDDQEIVALVGAHCLGRAHPDRSGYDGPWTMSPTRFSNLFFKDLLNRKWSEKKWGGPRQFTDASGKLMMLPGDLALVEDPKFLKYVKKYAEDKEAFFRDFASAYARLIALGVPRPSAL